MIFFRSLYSSSLSFSPYRKLDNRVNKYFVSNSKQAKDGNYAAMMTYDLRPLSERSSTLNVSQRMATGAGFGTVTKTGNDYLKDWTSGGATLTITKNDIN